MIKRNLGWGWLGLSVNASVACLNGYFVYRNWGHPMMFLSGLCVLVSTGVCVLIVRSARKSKKEEKPSSPSQQPTSGTSQNPSPSPSLDLSLAVKSLTITGNFFHPSPSPSESVSQLQPEARPMPVVGFRSWHLQPRHRLGIGPGWRLCSYNRQYGIWEPGMNRATCYAVSYNYSPYTNAQPDFHSAPMAECSCGFYVLTDFDKVPFATAEYMTDNRGHPIGEKSVTMVVGAVVGWGRVVQHDTEGWRAEKVQVIALLDCKVDAEHLRITNEVAESYGVPVLGRKALELLAKEYGDPLPMLEKAR